MGASLKGDAPFTAAMDTFNIVDGDTTVFKMGGAGKEGVLQIKSSPDFEAAASYTLTISGEDSTDPGSDESATVTVTIIDVK